MVPTSPPDCPFCAIVAGLVPNTREVYRTREVVAFFPTEPATLGHTMVIPARHAETLTELTAAEVSTLALTTKLLAQWIEQELQPEGLNVVQSNGAVAEQTVPHVHFHVVPRWRDDALGPIWPESTNFTDGAKDFAWHALAARALSDG